MEVMVVTTSTRHTGSMARVEAGGSSTASIRSSSKKHDGVGLVRGYVCKRKESEKASNMETLILWGS